MNGRSRTVSDKALLSLPSLPGEIQTFSTFMFYTRWENNVIFFTRTNAKSAIVSLKKIQD